MTRRQATMIELRYLLRELRTPRERLPKALSFESDARVLEQCPELHLRRWAPYYRFTARKLREASQEEC